MRGIDITVVTSNGETIQNRPLRGAGRPNPACAGFVAGQNNIEDPLSVGLHIAYGNFRTIHVGDITKNKERDLMCPNNPVGTVDVLLGLHHGQATSNSPVIVHALQPRVGIMNNGTRKGAEPETMMTLASSPGFEDLWQIHFSQLTGQEYTQPGMFIANLLDEPSTTMPIQPVIAAALWPQSAAGAGAQRSGVLDQAPGTDRRHVYRHQSAQQFFQDLHAALSTICHSRRPRCISIADGRESTRNQNNQRSGRPT